MRRRTDPKDISYQEQAVGASTHYRQCVLPEPSATRTARCGRGWGEKHLRNCLCTAETFPDKRIVSALMRQLIWSHLLLAGCCTTGLLRRDVPGHRADAGTDYPYRRTRKCALTQSRQDAKEKIMKDALCGFAPLRETVLETRFAANVTKLLEGE